MLNGDLYPKGKKLFHTGFDTEVEYVCCAGNGVHIVLAPPLDCIDDRVREVKATELVDETVRGLCEKETRKADDACLAWISRNQTTLYRSYAKAMSQVQGYLPENREPQRGFLLYAILQYEIVRRGAQRLSKQLEVARH